MRHPDAAYCGDRVHGDFLEGPTRLSLVDTASLRLINTVEIGKGDDPAGNFWVPTRVSSFYYKVPRPDSNKEGAPKILDLRDFTGDGVAAEFVLFAYAACGIVSTSILGYSEQTDRVVHYAVEVSEGNDAPRVESWVEQIFAREPVRPGQWDFTWRPGHGDDSIIHEQVSFDSVRQMFVNRRTIRE